MANAIKVPSRTEVRELLAGLLGDVTVSEVKAPADAPSDCVSVYVDDERQLAAACVVGFDLAVATGAAIALMPVGVVEEARRSGRFSNSLRDNLCEVMNVLAALLCNEESAHVKFTALYPTRADAPADSLALAAKPGGRLAVDVDLGDYGKGHLSILTR